MPASITNKLSCIQINLRHSAIATSTLFQLLIDNAIDIAFIQEPYVEALDGTILLQDLPQQYVAYHHLNDEHAYGASILITKRIKSQYSHLIGENHCVVVDIEVDPKFSPITL